MKNAWTKKVPSKNGWYWMKYIGKRGPTIVPCSITHFMASKEYVVNAFGAIFCSHTPGEFEKFHVFFGARIEEPKS